MEHQQARQSDQMAPPSRGPAPAPPVRTTAAPLVQARGHLGNRAFGQLVQRMCTDCEEEATAPATLGALPEATSSRPVDGEEEDAQQPIQAKLEVSSPGDPLEEEADRAAEAVMRMPDSSAPPGIQRACAACEEDEEVHRQALDEPEEEEPVQAKAAAGHAPPAAGARVQVERARGGGEPLAAPVRAFFEPRFGSDFGNVRVHHDAAADEAARSVRARAYTRGRDIVFAGGEYQPGSDRGRALLAHELAHVVQQGHGRALSVVQRAASDFEIRGKFANAASFPNFVFFDAGSSTPDGVEKAKIAPFALPASDMLTLNGFASEEGSAATNLASANSRLNKVAAELVSKGHVAAKITKNPLPDSGEGRIDYRRLRAVEILRPGGASTVPAAAAPTTVACAGSKETDFLEGEDAAEKMIDKSTTALTPPIGAAMSGQLTRFFPGWAAADAATVKTKLGDIKTQLGRLKPAANHRCATIKYPACESGADAENTGAGAAALMTLCPSFFDAGKTKKDRGGILLHEAAHGTPGLITKDHAYAHERMIEFLSLAVALNNSDSYRLLVRLFDTAGSMTVGPTPPDPLTGGMGPAEKTSARRTVAWTEKWLIWSYQEMSSLYKTIQNSIPGPAWTNAYYKATMDLVEPLFGLTPSSSLPTKTDKVKVAAIHDRFLRMRRVFWSTPVTLHKVAAAGDTWAPGPGGSVDLGTAFFAATPRAQLDRMLTAIAKATTGISAGFVSKYVTLADKIRTHQGGGAPTP
jgi:hypothetical protein